jgi:hypothetical protein
MLEHANPALYSVEEVGSIPGYGASPSAGALH